MRVQKNSRFRNRILQPMKRLNSKTRRKLRKSKERLSEEARQQEARLRELRRTLKPLSPGQDGFLLATEIARRREIVVGEMWAELFKGPSDGATPEQLASVGPYRGVRSNENQEARCLIQAIGRDWPVYVKRRESIPIELFRKLVKVATGRLSGRRRAV